MGAKTLGETILAAITKQKMSQVEVAQKMKTSPQYLSDIINDKANPTYRTLVRMADALGVSVASLLPRSTKSSKKQVVTTNGHKEESHA